MLGVERWWRRLINGLFYRHCVNYTLSALEYQDVRGVVENLTRGGTSEGEKTPEFLAEILESGGVREKLKREGYIT